VRAVLRADTVAILATSKRLYLRALAPSTQYDTLPHRKWTATSSHQEELADTMVGRVRRLWEAFQAKDRLTKVVLVSMALVILIVPLIVGQATGLWAQIGVSLFTSCTPLSAKFTAQEIQPFSQSAEVSWCAHTPTSTLGPGPSNTSASSIPPTPPIDPNVRGICQFNDYPTVDAVNDPNIRCITILAYWRTIEPSKGHFNWSPIDNTLDEWSKAGKSAIVRVTMSGYCNKLMNNDNCNRTPDWVYDDMRQGNTDAEVSVTDEKGGVHPIFWNTHFQQDWQGFVQSLAHHLDTSPYKHDVIAVNVSDGNNGEPEPDDWSSWNNDTVKETQAWDAVGYSDYTWGNQTSLSNGSSVLQQLSSYFMSAFAPTHIPLSVQVGYVDISRSDPNVGADYLQMNFRLASRVGATMWWQNDGLTSAGANYWNPSVPHVEEQVLDTTRTGDTLLGDIRTGLNLKGNYILLFGGDIAKAEDPVHNCAYSAALTWGASQVSDWHATPPAISVTNTGVTTSGTDPWTVWIAGSNLKSSDVACLVDTTGHQWGNTIPLIYSASGSGFRLPSDHLPSGCNSGEPCTLYGQIVDPTTNAVSNTFLLTLPGSLKDAALT
jgi:hypothetical protein